MASWWPPSSAMPSQHEPSDLDLTKPGKWRTTAIQQLFKSGHSVEDIAKYSRLPLSRLVEILGTGAVVTDLYLNGRKLTEISRMIHGLTLVEAAKCLGGISRSGNHRYAAEAEETDSGVVAESLDSLRKGRRAA